MTLIYLLLLHLRVHILLSHSFRDLAAEREANKSLGTVQNVQQLSREAIEQAEALQASLAAIEPDAASARLTAEGAEITAARNRQVYTGISAWI